MDRFSRKPDTLKTRIQSLSDGVVTGIKAQSDPFRVSVFVDGEFAFGMHSSLLSEHTVSVGGTISADKQRELILRDLRIRARQTAVNYLSYKPRTRIEIEKRLRRFTDRDEIVEAVADDLARDGLIDDTAFANEFVTARYRQKGHGPARLRSDLMRKGVAREIIDGALQTLESVDLRERAVKLLRGKWTTYARVEDPLARKRRAVGFLRRNGYSVGVSISVFEEVKLEAESA